MFTQNPTAKISKFDVARAARALRALSNDPDDLPQVFTILESLQGNTLERLEQRFSTTDAGRRLLADRPDLGAILSDREGLRAMPEGSLGRAYLAFVESENISAAGIRDADKTKHEALAPRPAFIHRRMRDTHDLWHAVTGYKGDVLGEAALLGFTLAQSWSFGIGLIVALGLFKTSGAPEARALILDGFRRARRAAWLPAQPWESMLAEPVLDVRARLGVDAPPVYTPVRSAELKMQRAA